MTSVHQVLSGAGPHDAVTDQAIAWSRALAEDGLPGEVYSDAIDPRVRDIAPLDRLDPQPGDVLSIHYSAYAPRLRPLMELPVRKLLVYHNVTPPGYLWRHNARVAVLCSLGRAQLPTYARAVDVAAAVSSFNARELEHAGARDVRLVPILFDPARLGPRRMPAPAEGPLVLCVGRLVPNKRHDLVLAAFAAWQRAHAPDARLVLAGEPMTPAYGSLIEGVAEDLGVRNVTFTGALPQPELNGLYAEADVLLSLSEHEGFCIPLLEAFHFDLPVVARPAGGMPEVGGDAVLWTGDEARDPAVVAELLQLAVGDPELRAELARRGRARLEENAPERVREAMRSAVRAALA